MSERVVSLKGSNKTCKMCNMNGPGVIEIWHKRMSHMGHLKRSDEAKNTPHDLVVTTSFSDLGGLVAKNSHIVSKVCSLNNSV